MFKPLSLSHDHPHAKLLFVWSALDLILLSAGVITVIASICFHRPNQLIINLIFDDIHFICGLVLGSAYLVTSAVSIPAILLRKGKLWALKALSWGLVILTIATLLELCDIWLSQPPAIQQAIQDKVGPSSTEEIVLTDSGNVVGTGTVLPLGNSKL